MPKKIRRKPAKKKVIKRKPSFNPYDQILLRTLMRARRRLTTKRLSELTGLSWATVKLHCMSLVRKKYVVAKRSGNRIYWGLK